MTQKQVDYNLALLNKQRLLLDKEMKILDEKIIANKRQLDYYKKLANNQFDLF